MAQFNSGFGLFLVLFICSISYTYAACKKGIFETLVDRVDQLERDVADLKNQVEGKKRVAFSATIKEEVTSGLTARQTIPFDTVVLNEGQAFDTTTHKFTCPVSGVYMFQSALLTTYKTWIQTEIMKDDEDLFKMLAHSADKHPGFDQGFNSVITSCNKGQKVYVRIDKDYGTELYSRKYTTFSGVLLWETQ